MGVYKRKTENGQWTTQTLKQAIEDVQKGRTVRSAAKMFGIPESTLRRRMKNEKKKDAPRLGRKCYYTPQQEKILANYLVKLSDETFYGLSAIQFRKLAFELAVKLKIKHNFNKEHKVAGKDWLNGFLRRNPIVSLRKPEATSINRIQGFNKTEVNRFFMNLEDMLQKYHFTKDRIVNMDETGISTVQVPEKVLAPKGKKRVGSLTSWERGNNTTVIRAISAAGRYVPPMFIFARGKNSHLLGRGAPASSIVECTKNGWTNTEMYLKWLKLLAKDMKPTAKDPLLLILDNHVSHATIEAFEFCKANDIHVLSLPPHTSHRLQPLDVTFFGPLKRAYYRQCDLYLKSNNFKKITPYGIAGIFNEAYKRVCSIDKAVNGFHATGMVPLNPYIFNDEEFVAELEMPNTEKENNTYGQLMVEAELTIANGIVTNTDIPLNLVSELQVSNSDMDENDQNRRNQNAQDDDDLISYDPMDLEATLSEVAPMPAMLPKKLPSVGIRQKQHSEILTSPGMRIILDEKKLKKEERLRKAEEAKKKRETNAQKKAEKEDAIRKKEILKAEFKAKKAAEMKK